jgi:hypothetical protein
MFSTLWLLGTDWNYLFDKNKNCIVTSRYKFTKDKGSFLRRTFAGMSWCTQFNDKLPVGTLFITSKTTDALMLVIKSTTVDQSTSSDSPNSFGKVNKTFAHFGVELLSVNLFFDCWFNHSSQISPAPYTKKVPDEIYRDLTTNRNAIVN